MVKLLTTGFQPEKWDPVRHETSLGVVEGRLEDSVGEETLARSHYAFRGIPYAHSPVGDLRFEDPVDATETWPDSYLDANHFGNVCPQFDVASKKVVGDENCLFLNIFTPTLPGSEDSDRLPVLVFIHGGAFIRGSSSVLAGGRLAGQNIVLVTFNYRLGALGFLTTEDEVIPGNFGTLDQLSALRWVQRNIADFGGDPERVTLGGFSAGAISSHAHMMSPLAEGLFNNVLMVSGSAHFPSIVQRTPRESARKLGEKLNCELKPSLGFKACLTTKTSEEIVTAQASIMRYEFWPMSFTLTIDGGMRKNPHLPGPILDLKPRSMPVFMELVPEEGFVFALVLMLLCGHPNNATAAYNELIPYIVSSIWFHPEEAEVVGKMAESFYLNERAKGSMDDLLEEVSEVLSGYVWTAYTTKSATEAASQGNTVYMALFTHKDPETPSWNQPILDMARSLGLTSPKLDTVVTHGDDLMFSFSKSRFTSDRDEGVAQFLVSNWANFLYNGTPAVPINEWPPLEPGGPVKFYEISTTPHLQKSPFREKEANFWLQTVPLMTQMRNDPEEGGFQRHMPLVIGAILTYISIALMNRRD
ncbi:esterase FE4-like [Macrobrachium rosenbergii]|uniref:esterase FE4-like n=1 Tax=Macrobrachium rosenbergii TaxID=79674 RepID=UPI0034D78299